MAVYTDASDSGWGYLTTTGLQGRGQWSRADRRRHINVRELMVPLLFLRHQDHLSHTHLCFHMDNVAAVHCVSKMGSSRSLPLLIVAEQLFAVAAARLLTLSAVHLPGRCNVWADALSRTGTSSVEWALHPDAFLDLTDLYGEPAINLFASPTNHLLPRFLSRTVATVTGGPDAFSTSWDAWPYIYLFPPSTSSIMTAVCGRLAEYRGRVLLIAPLWKAQPWCQERAGRTLLGPHRSTGVVGQAFPPSTLPHRYLIRQYVAATDGRSHTRLFIWPDTKKPLSRLQITKVLCSVIDAADPGKAPRGTDVRAMSASMAFLQHYSLDQARRDGQWASTHSFVFHYLDHHLEPVPCANMAGPPRPGPSPSAL